MPAPSQITQHQQTTVSVATDDASAFIPKRPKRDFFGKFFNGSQRASAYDLHEYLFMPLSVTRKRIESDDNEQEN